MKLKQPDSAASHKWIYRFIDEDKRAGWLLYLQFQGHMMHTLPLDNGKECAVHARIALDSRSQIYLADPYASCQLGTNENTSSLMRQYLPKGSDRGSS